MAAIPRVDPFPMTCPDCAAAAGFPFKATTVADGSGVDVAMRCHTCRHEWLAFMAALTPDPLPRSRVLVHHRAS